MAQQAILQTQGPVATSAALLARIRALWLIISALWHSLEILIGMAPLCYCCMLLAAAAAGRYKCIAI